MFFSDPLLQSRTAVSFLRDEISKEVKFICDLIETEGPKGEERGWTFKFFYFKVIFILLKVAVDGYGGCILFWGPTKITEK